MFANPRITIPTLKATSCFLFFGFAWLRNNPNPRLTNMPQDSKYSCNDYREEMRLLGLKKRLNDNDLTPAEQRRLEAEISKLEAALQMD
jgi:hypothetical protein